MTREAFIGFLCEEHITFRMAFPGGIPFIYVEGKPTNVVTFNGITKNYTPYLRFSHFDERPGMIYVRDNGLCGYKTDKWCMTECIKYRDSFKEE